MLSLPLLAGCGGAGAPADSGTETAEPTASPSPAEVTSPAVEVSKPAPTTPAAGGGGVAEERRATEVASNILWARFGETLDVPLGSGIDTTEYTVHMTEPEVFTPSGAAQPVSSTTGLRVGAEELTAIRTSITISVDPGARYPVSIHSLTFGVHSGGEIGYQLHDEAAGYSVFQQGTLSAGDSRVIEAAFFVTDPADVKIFIDDTTRTTYFTSFDLVAQDPDRTTYMVPADPLSATWGEPIELPDGQVITYTIEPYEVVGDVTPLADEEGLPTFALIATITNGSNELAWKTVSLNRDDGYALVGTYDRAGGMTPPIGDILPGETLTLRELYWLEDPDAVFVQGTGGGAAYYVTSDGQYPQEGSWH